MNTKTQFVIFKQLSSVYILFFYILKTEWSIQI